MVNLVYAGGMTQYTHESAFGIGYAPLQRTPVLDKCPYFDHVQAQLPGWNLWRR